MFCNNCGKTLTPEAIKCPNCGHSVGESRFEGSGYTSSQERFVPGRTQRSGYVPYTKTTYSSMPDEEADVYSRTSYRPVLSEDEGGQTTGQVQEEAPEQAENTPEEQNGAPEREEPETQAAVPPEAAEPSTEGQAPDAEKRELDALGLEIKPLEPIKKTGISPEVQRYIEQMNQHKTRRQRKMQQAGSADSETHEADEEQTAYDSQPVAASVSRVGMKKWALRIGGVVAVIALIIAGILMISYQTATRSKIPGVTYDLYTEGLALIKSHVSSDYRANIIKLWNEDTKGTTVTAQQEKDRQEIQALLPENSMENDQLFIDTLLSIQEAIDGAAASDVIAANNVSNDQSATLSELSSQNWQIVSNAITRLEGATEVIDLNGIIEGTKTSVIEPIETEVTPEPVTYKNLKKGMKNNKQVKKLQDRLYKLGWFNGRADGDFGPATQQAVKKFQKAVGVEQDGIATPELQELLFSDDAPRGGSKVTPAPDATPAADGEDGASDATDDGAAEAAQDDATAS